MKMNRTVALIFVCGAMLTSSFVIQKKQRGWFTFPRQDYYSRFTAKAPPRGIQSSRAPEGDHQLGPVLSAHLRRGQPLLTKEQEFRLGSFTQQLVRVEDTQKLLAEGLGRRPTPLEWAVAAGLKDEEVLSELVWKGRWAKQELVLGNLRLVMSIAHRYRKRGASFQDLVQEGMVALGRAAEKYDPERGYRFSTYATWWIRQRIHKLAVQPNTLSRVPEKMQILMRKADVVSARLFAQLGRNPTKVELAAALGVTEKQLDAARAALRLVYSVDGNSGTSGLLTWVPSSELRPEDVTERASLRESLNKVRRLRAFE